MYKKNISYVFISGRKDKLNLRPENYAKEFFYGYQYFQNKGYETNIIEFNEKKSIFNFVYYILNRISDLPIYGQYLTNRKNYDLLKKSSDIIFTNQKTAYSMLPLLLVSKIVTKVNSHVFIMGLFGKPMKYKIKYFFREFFIKVLIKSNKNLIFLGRGEYEYAIRKYKKYKNKFIFLPFAIDSDFWNYSKPKKVKNNILFIGNDGMRDYDFLLELIKKMPNYDFDVVSNKINENKILKNLNLYKGDWGKYEYSDEFIKELYKKNDLTILPIKETFQPSGQSVALQSMSTGTPVMITLTKGFWDYQKFKHRENIFFLKKNEIDLWVEEIESFFNEENIINDVSHFARESIERDYELKKFCIKLEEIIINN